MKYPREWYLPRYHKVFTAFALLIIIIMRRAVFWIYPIRKRGWRTLVIVEPLVDIVEPPS
jgi:hypothetical protein